MKSIPPITKSIKPWLTYGGMTILLIVLYVLASYFLAPAGHDGLGTLASILFLMTGHFVICLLSGIMLQIMGKPEKAALFFISDIVMVALLLILGGTAMLFG